MAAGGSFWQRNPRWIRIASPVWPAICAVPPSGTRRPRPTPGFKTGARDTSTVERGRTRRSGIGDQGLGPVACGRRSAPARRRTARLGGSALLVGESSRRHPNHERQDPDIHPDHVDAAGFPCSERNTLVAPVGVPSLNLRTKRNLQRDRPLPKRSCRPSITTLTPPRRPTRHSRSSAAVGSSWGRRAPGELRTNHTHRSTSLTAASPPARRARAAACAPVCSSSLRQWPSRGPGLVEHVGTASVEETGVVGVAMAAVYGLPR